MVLQVGPKTSVVVCGRVCGSRKLQWVIVQVPIDLWFGEDTLASEMVTVRNLGLPRLSSLQPRDSPF